MSKFSLPDPELLPRDVTVFSFLVGQNRYESSVTIAAVHCMKVRLLLLCDPTAQSMRFPYQDPQGQFVNFVKFIHGQPIVISATNVDFLSLTAEFFGCTDLMRAISDVKQHMITPDRALQIVFQCNSISQCQDEIACIAHCFPQLVTRPELSQAPLFVIDAVLGHSELCTDGMRESDLFRFVSDLVHRRGREFTQLFAHVQFEKLDARDIDVFLRQVPRELITGALWDAVARRLAAEISK